MVDPTPAEIIAAEMQKPASISSDAGSVARRSLGELIDAARYVDGQAAAKRPARGIRFTQLIPPGSP